MTRSMRRCLLTVAVLVSVCAVTLWPAWSADNASTTDAQAVQRAWARLRQSDAYTFSVDLQQTTTPVATLGNVGRSNRRQSVYLEGQARPTEQYLAFTLWSDSGSAADPASGQQMRVEAGRTFMRRGAADWQAVPSFSDSFAPNGDVLAFLAGAQNVTRQPDERGLARYTFDLDGPTVARYLRDTYQAALEDSGQLPAGMTLQISQQVAQLIGHGEVLIDADGLPRFQALYLNFPPGETEQVSAQIEVTFGDRVVTALGPFDAASRALAANALPISLLAVFGAAVLSSLWLAQRRKPIYAALVLALSASMVAAPLAQSARAADFVQAQRAGVDQQRAAQAQAQRQQQAQQQLITPRLPPNVSPLERGTDRVVAGPIGLGVAARPVTVQNSVSYTTTLDCKTVLLHPEIDSDRDGLADCQEFFLGTDPDYFDSDGDTLTDTLEVAGYVLGAQTWYGDPLRSDTNQDGLSDNREWSTDTDGDGTPDLWSRDNDADGVPDNLDLSPFQANATPFTKDAPLSLVFNQLTPDKITYVELQLRPVITSHLRYASNVFKWPLGDDQGQMLEVDGKTFKDVYPESQSLQDANGNVKLQPMLEIRTDGQPDNLPDADTLRQYGISTHRLTADDSRQVAYVPLQLVSDTGDNRVAFEAKLVYRPGATWGHPHQYRLVWMVQALTETCQADGWEDGHCKHIDLYNEPTLLVIYPDDFTLTGLQVREEHGTEIAAIYQDPAVVPGPDRATRLTRWAPLTDLVFGLDRTFLAARTITDTNGRPQLDMTLPEIQRRFDHTLNAGVPISPTRFNIDQNVLRVDLFSYPHVDLGVYTMATTETKRILNSAYTPAWSATAPITPTILFARVERFRSLGLDTTPGSTNVVWTGRLLTLSLPASSAAGSGLTAVPERTLATLNWGSFAYGQQAWAAVPLGDYLDNLAGIYPPGELGSTDISAEGGQLVLSAYYLNLYQGVSSLVALDGVPVPTPHIELDIDIAEIAEVINRELEHFKEGFKVIAEAMWEVLELIRHGEEGIKEEIEELNSLFAAKANAFWERPADPESNFMPIIDVAGFERLTSRLIYLDKLTTIIGCVLAVIWLVLNFISMATGHWLDTTIGHAFAIFIGVAFVALAALKVTLSTIIAVKILSQLGRAQGIELLMRDYGEALKASAILLVIMVAVVILIGVLTIAFSPGVKWASLEADVIWGQILAVIVVMIIFFLIAAIPVVGEILALLVGLIDFILGFFDKDLSGWLFKHILKVDPLVGLDTDTGDSQLGSDQPDRGFTVGNTLQWSFTLTTTARHITSTTDSGALASALKRLVQGNPGENPFDSEDILNTAVRWELARDYAALDTTWGERRSDWQWPWIYGTWQWGDHGYQSFNLYTSRLTDSLRVNGLPLPHAGVNLPITASLNMGYDLPVLSCLVWNCNTRQTGPRHLSVDDATLVMGQFDVFPATLDELVAWNWSEPPCPIGWLCPTESNLWALPTPADHDNDGLLAYAAVGGYLDPNDTRWDTDGDTLSDFYEMVMNTYRPDQGGAAYNWLMADTDGDGLRDDEEARLNTNPARADSDDDGRSDYAEVRGYAFTYGHNRSTLVRSNPNRADSDLDGFDDAAEFALYQLNPLQNPYKPDVVNANPLALSLGVSRTVRGFVAPGWTLPLSATVVNLANSPVRVTGRAVISAGYALTLTDGISHTLDFTLGTNERLDYATLLHVQANVPSTRTQITSAACGTLQPPIVYLPLNEPAGATVFNNALASTYTATCSAGLCPIAGVTGVVGTAVQFTAGTQTLNLQNTNDGFYLPYLSIAAWVRPQPNTSGVLVAKRTVTETYTLSYAENAGVPALDFTLNDQTWATPQTLSLRVCPANWQAGAYNHVIVERQSAGAAILVNGQPAAPGTCGSAAPAPATPAGVSLGGAGYTGLLDEVYIFDHVLTQGEITALLQPIDLHAPTAELAACDLLPTAHTTLQIDNDVPTSTLVSLRNDQFLTASGVLIVGGFAKDPTSYITRVEIQIDGGDWHTVSGAEVWTYAWDVQRTGRHTLRTRATDAVGNVETPGPAIVVYLDRSAPQAMLTLPAMSAVGFSPVGDWTVALDGQVSDLCAGVKSVEVLLEGQGPAAGNGWQPASVQGQDTHACLANSAAPAAGDLRPWSLRYVLPRNGQAGRAPWSPTGLYTVSVRTADQLGNVTTADRYLTGTLHLDAAAPIAQLDDDLSALTTFTTPLTLRGLITDPGLIASGVNDLHVSLAPVATVDVLTDARLLLPLDEPPGSQLFRDVSGQGGVGTCPAGGCPLADRAGKIDRAVQFDGQDDAITITAYSPLHITQSLSLAAWFNTSTLIPGNQLLAGRWSATGQDGAYGLYWWGNELTFGVQNAAHVKAEAFSHAAYNDGQWHHAVGVWTGSAASLYVDGQLVAQQPMPTLGALNNSTLPLRLGAGSAITGDTQTHHYAGLIDEVAVFAAALSAAEVQALYARGAVYWAAATVQHIGALTSTWSYSLPTFPAGEYQLNVRGTDVLGNWQLSPREWSVWRGEVNAATLRRAALPPATATITALMPVTITAPAPVTITVFYTNSQGVLTAIAPGDTLRDVLSPTLIVHWTASAGASYYRAGLSDRVELEPPKWVSYTSAVTSHAQAAHEAIAYYAHVAAYDVNDQFAWSVFGPIYVDTPLTPDYAPLTRDPVWAADAARLQTGGRGDLYRGWQTSGCTQIGVNRAVADTATAFNSLSAVQRLHLTWDATTLRLSWTGAYWDGVGNLFIYLGLGSGLTTTHAFEPDQSGDSLTLPFGANWLVWVDDADTARLLGWDGTQWTMNAALSATAFRFTHWQGADYTDLALPLAALGVIDPAQTALDLIAVASEVRGLRTWAVMPPNNPHTSARLGVSSSDAAVSLHTAYHWDQLAANVCPAHSWADYDLRATLVVTPQAGITQTRAGGVYGSPPRQVGTARDVLGDGDTLTGTLTVDNAGEAAAPDVWVRLTTRGALRLPGGHIITETDGLHYQQDIHAGALAAGASYIITGTGVVDGALRPFVTQPDRLALHVEVYAASPLTSTVVEHFEVQHQGDFDPPADLTVRLAEAPAGTATTRSGWRLLTGTVHDLSGVPQIEVQLDDPHGALHTIACPDDHPFDGQWLCAVNLSGSDGDVWPVRARATDGQGQISAWTDWYTITLDEQAPTVTLDAASEAAVADHIIRAQPLVISGQVLDTQPVSQVEVCVSAARARLAYALYLPLITTRHAAVGAARSSHAALAAASGPERCQTYDLESGAAISGTWRFVVPPLYGVDWSYQTLSITGLDAAGNRSVTVQRTVTLDGRAPVARVHSRLTQISQAAYALHGGPIMTGQITDGSGQAQLAFAVRTPTNGLWHFTGPVGQGYWQFKPPLLESGWYHYTVEARDAAGNVAYVGAYDLEVVP